MSKLSYLTYAKEKGVFFVVCKLLSPVLKTTDIRLNHLFTGSTDVLVKYYVMKRICGLYQQILTQAYLLIPFWATPVRLSSSVMEFTREHFRTSVLRWWQGCLKGGLKQEQSIERLRGDEAPSTVQLCTTGFSPLHLGTFRSNGAKFVVDFLFLDRTIPKVWG